MASILDNINAKRDGYLIHHFCHDHSSERQTRAHSDSSDSQQQLDTLEADINTLLSQPIGERARIFYDEELNDQTTALLNSTKPWAKDPNYFQNVHVNALALLKMSIHARSGGDIEIMGMLTGKIVKNGIVVMDVYPLPVEGTETRVNAQAEGYEFMVQYKDSLKKAGRNENIVGWYHSHPGYGCWLSGIDVSTQSLNQQFQDPYLAIVIDPHRTLSNGIVEIGAFRTYPSDYIENNPNNYGSLGSLVVSPDPRNNKNSNTSKISQKRKTDASTIPEDKAKDFGLHNSKYYSLSIEIFRSDTDFLILQNLWNKFWIKNLLGDSQSIEEKDLIETFIQDKLDVFHQKIANFGTDIITDTLKQGSNSSFPPDSLQSLSKSPRKRKGFISNASASSPVTSFNVLSTLNQSQLSPFTRANILSKLGGCERATDPDGSDSEMNDADSDTESRQDDDSESISIAQRLESRDQARTYLTEKLRSTSPLAGTGSSKSQAPSSKRTVKPSGDSLITGEELRGAQQVAAEAGRNLMTLKLQEILFLNE